MLFLNIKKTKIKYTVCKQTDLIIQVLLKFK